MRPFRFPAADADVDVVALRKDPAVPARDRSELDHGEPSVSLVERRVAFIGDTVRDRPAQPESARGGAVRTVRADHDLRLDRRLPYVQRQPPGPLFHAHLRPVAKLGPCGRGLLDEVLVETAALSHEHEGPPAALPLEAAPPAQAELHPVDLVLDHRSRIDRQLADGP